MISDSLKEELSEMSQPQIEEVLSWLLMYDDSPFSYSDHFELGPDLINQHIIADEDTERRVQITCLY